MISISLTITSESAVYCYIGISLEAPKSLNIGSRRWVQGGKLPGLRGGPDRFGCSGGNETAGTGCFSTRVMWRTSGAGEGVSLDDSLGVANRTNEIAVYAYIPTSQKGFCSASGVTCNSDYGTSLDRGSFSFVSGQWQTVWMVVILNDPTIANGVVE